MTPADLLAAALRADPGRPLVTSYDDTCGERVELSVATTANWVAKIGNALADEWGLDEGDRVALDLPPHWTGAVAALAVWNAGGEVVDAGAGDFSIRLAAEPALTDRELRLTLAPMGLDLSGLVAGWPDAAVTTAAPGGSDAAAEAAAMGLPPQARQLSTVPFATREAAVRTLLAPLAAAGSLVVVRGAVTPERLAEIAAVERVTQPAG